MNTERLLPHMLPDAASLRALVEMHRESADYREALARVTAAQEPAPGDAAQPPSDSAWQPTSAAGAEWEPSDAEVRECAAQMLQELRPSIYTLDEARQKMAELKPDASLMAYSRAALLYAHTLFGGECDRLRAERDSYHQMQTKLSQQVDDLRAQLAAAQRPAPAAPGLPDVPPPEVIKHLPNTKLDGPDTWTDAQIAAVDRLISWARSLPTAAANAGPDAEAVEIAGRLPRHPADVGIIGPYAKALADAAAYIRRKAAP